MQKLLAFYSQAAEDGNAQALHELAVMYDSGQGVKPNKKKAHDLYMKAAQKDCCDGKTLEQALDFIQ